MMVIVIWNNDPSVLKLWQLAASAVNIAVGSDDMTLMLSVTNIWQTFVRNIYIYMLYLTNTRINYMLYCDIQFSNILAFVSTQGRCRRPLYFFIAIYLCCTVQMLSLSSGVN